jgi:hypothetical protein
MKKRAKKNFHYAINKALNLKLRICAFNLPIPSVVYCWRKYTEEGLLIQEHLAIF